MGETALRILVVDDEPAMREVLEMRLSEWGYGVILAATATRHGSSPSANTPMP